MTIMDFWIGVQLPYCLNPDWQPDCEFASVLMPIRLSPYFSTMSLHPTFGDRQTKSSWLWQRDTRAISHEPLRKRVFVRHPFLGVGVSFHLIPVEHIPIDTYSGSIQPPVSDLSEPLSSVGDAPTLCRWHKRQKQCRYALQFSFYDSDKWAELSSLF